MGMTGKTIVFYLPESASVEKYKEFVDEVIRRNEPVAMIDLAKPDCVACVVSPLDVIKFVSDKIMSIDRECKIRDYIQATSVPCHEQP